MMRCEINDYYKDPPTLSGAAQGGPIKAEHDRRLKGWSLAANERAPLFSQMSQP